MPIKTPRLVLRPQLLATLAAAAALVQPAQGQTDDSAPFYAGASLGVSHVSNLYRQSNATNSDTVVSAGLLGGLDHRMGRQHLKLDGSLQDNRYATNSSLNNHSYSLSGALDWQTVGNVSGTLSAKSDRSLADFNIGGGAQLVTRKNTESDDEYRAVARLGIGTRYSLEAGWDYRKRDFSAFEYDIFVFHQNTASLGLYATPAGNVTLGLVGRHTRGQNPRYPVTLSSFIFIFPNDYTRNDLDFTTRWNTGGSSSLDTRISRSRIRNSLVSLTNFGGTTGAIGWNWQATSKLLLNLQVSRDTGQESQVRATDVNSRYTTWQLGGSYALTGKLNLNASASTNRSRRYGNSSNSQLDTFTNNQAYTVGLRWAYSRSFSLGCQYDHAGRDSSVTLNNFSANSYGCTGQAILY